MRVRSLGVCVLIALAPSCGDGKGGADAAVSPADAAVPERDAAALPYAAVEWEVAVPIDLLVELDGLGANADGITVFANPELVVVGADAQEAARIGWPPGKSVLVATAAPGGTHVLWGASDANAELARYDSLLIGDVTVIPFPLSITRAAVATASDRDYVLRWSRSPDGEDYVDLLTVDGAGTVTSTRLATGDGFGGKQPGWVDGDDILFCVDHPAASRRPELLRYTASTGAHELIPVGHGAPEFVAQCDVFVVGDSVLVAWREPTEAGIEASHWIAALERSTLSLSFGPTRTPVTHSTAATALVQGQLVVLEDAGENELILQRYEVATHQWLGALRIQTNNPWEWDLHGLGMAAAADRLYVAFARPEGPTVPVTMQKLAPLP